VRSLICKVPWGLLVLLGVQATHACVVLPILPESAPSVLDRSTDIGIVRINAIEKELEGVRIYLTPLSVLKGDASSLQSVFFRCPRCVPETLQFGGADHESVEFLSGVETSVSALPDCSVVPSARVGRDYLYVKSDPISRFVLEELSETDRWLHWVGEYLEKGIYRPLTAAEYLDGAKRIDVLSCEKPELKSHFRCGNSMRFILEVREKSSRRLLYPSSDGNCVLMQEEFMRWHGFELRGVDHEGWYCLDQSP
jgi:hypothetical protein